MSAIASQNAATSYPVHVRHQGRVVLPAPLRARHEWVDGTELLMIDTASGVLMGTEDDIEALVQREFRTEGSVVDELLAERCRQADKDRA